MGSTEESFESKSLNIKRPNLNLKNDLIAEFTVRSIRIMR